MLLATMIGTTAAMSAAAPMPTTRARPALSPVSVLTSGRGDAFEAPVGVGMPSRPLAVQWPSCSCGAHTGTAGQHTGNDPSKLLGRC